MAAELHRTHHLECEGFAEEFRSLVEMVLPDTTAAIVRLHEDEMEMEPDGDDCRRTWNALRHRGERVPEKDRNEATAWRIPTTTETGQEALFDLITLTDGIAGAHFVFQIELRNSGAPVLESISHHSDAGVDATLLEGEIRANEIVGLSGHDACLVPTETQFDWVAEDRRWKIQGGSLCVETLDGRKASCYGLTGLEQATIADDGTVLGLTWKAGELPNDSVGKLLSWFMDKLYDPPQAVPCETPKRANAVNAHLQELLAAYDGREI